MSSITITNMSECSKCQILFQFWDHLVACLDASALSAVIRNWSVRRFGSGSHSFYKNPLPDFRRIWRNFWAYWHIWESFLFKSTSHSDCESCACCGKCSFSGPLEWVMRGRSYQNHQKSTFDKLENVSNCLPGAIFLPNHCIMKAHK